MYLLDQYVLIFRGLKMLVRRAFIFGILYFRIEQKALDIINRRERNYEMDKNVMYKGLVFDVIVFWNISSSRS